MDNRVSEPLEKLGELNFRVIYATLTHFLMHFRALPSPHFPRTEQLYRPVYTIRFVVYDCHFGVCNLVT